MVSFDVGKHQEVFLTECFNETGKIILTGAAIIIYPDKIELLKYDK